MLDEVFSELEVVSICTLEQAIDDGVLVPLLQHRWVQLTGGKPLVATAHLHGEVSLAALMEIWNQYVTWRTDIMPTLPEEERLFATTMQSKTVWVIEDGAAFTLLYPEDY
jgi:hypothetical protein